MTKARRRGLLVHTGWSGKSQMQWRIVLLFLFFMSEPVGMCHSAVELNGSCCSRKTNKSPSTQATSVATFLALSIQELWKGTQNSGRGTFSSQPGPSLLTLSLVFHPAHWQAPGPGQPQLNPTRKGESTEAQDVLSLIALLLPGPQGDKQSHILLWLGAFESLFQF